MNLRPLVFVAAAGCWLVVACIVVASFQPGLAPGWKVVGGLAAMAGAALGAGWLIAVAFSLAARGRAPRTGLDSRLASPPQARLYGVGCSSCRRVLAFVCAVCGATCCEQCLRSHVCLPAPAPEAQAHTRQ